MAPEYGSEEWETIYQEILRKRLGRASKPYIMGTPEWAHAYEQKIQGDEAYKELASRWEGTVVFHIIAEPDNGMKRDIYILMDLWHGDCRGVRIVPPEAGEAADYVLSAPATIWKRLGEGKLDANKALMQAKLKLKGDLSTLVRYSKAAARLGAISARTGGRSPVDLNGEEAKELKALDREFEEKLLQP